MAHGQVVEQALGLDGLQARELVLDGRLDGPLGLDGQLAPHVRLERQRLVELVCSMVGMVDTG